MPEPKLKPTEKSVERLVGEIPDELVRDDCYELIRMMQKVTRTEPILWAGNMIGFGRYHYVYESGHEGDAFLAGFAVRKQNITLYVMHPELPERDDLLKKLGKQKPARAVFTLKN